MAGLVVRGPGRVQVPLSLVARFVLGTVETPFYHVSSDTSLMRTLVYNGKFCLSQRKRRSYIFSKINLLNTDTRLIRTLLHAPSVSVLTSFQYSAEFNSLNRLVT